MTENLSQLINYGATLIPVEFFTLLFFQTCLQGHRSRSMIISSVGFIWYMDCVRLNSLRNVLKNPQCHEEMESDYVRESFKTDIAREIFCLLLSASVKTLLFNYLFWKSRMVLRHEMRIKVTEQATLWYFMLAKYYNLYRTAILPSLDCTKRKLRKFFPFFANCRPSLHCSSNAIKDAIFHKNRLK